METADASLSLAEESSVPPFTLSSRQAGAGKVVLCERKTIGRHNSMSGAMCGQQAEMTDTIAKPYAPPISTTISTPLAEIAVSLNMHS